MDGQLLFAMFLATLLVGPVLMIISIVFGYKKGVKWLWVTNILFLVLTIVIAAYYVLQVDQIATQNPTPGGTGVLIMLLISSWISIPTAISFFLLAGAIFMEQRKKAKEIQA
ncbi:DUF3810 domain-containing protein [Jeotgalibacillus salarius]|uniref:Uncharacterized protein n=1 Tax=Jeotgalibacillus salarius TaxID=546023 RepID=A0A4Y8LB37_9BACL|nr:DUF3810 domain-containing protein [Jeotgalibacillus salarius]TFD99587.1 hypothetical protein E2626_13810 [Jeotgalibacillus salarius]